jgi:hypothetical protein
MALGLVKAVIIGDPAAAAERVAPVNGPPTEFFRSLVGQLAQPVPPPAGLAALARLADDAMVGLFTAGFKDRLYFRLYALARQTRGELTLPASIQERHAKLRTRMDFAAQELAALRDAGAASGTKYIVLKGESVQRFYPPEYARYSWDLDLAVTSEDDLWRTLLLLRERGYTWPYPGVAALDVHTGQLLAQFKSFTTVPGSDLPFSIELTLHGIQTGWQNALRLPPSWYGSVHEAGQPIRYLERAGSVMVLLAECVEREVIRIRDLIDWNMLTETLRPEEARDLGRMIDEAGLGYVVLRLRKAAARLGLPLDALQGALDHLIPLVGDHHTVHRLLRHEGPRTATTVSTLDCGRVTAGALRQLIFELVDRRRLLKGISLVDDLVPAGALFENGMWVYLIPLPACPDSPLVARHYVKTDGIALLGTPSGYFLLSTSGVVSAGRARRASQGARVLAGMVQ